MFIQPQVSQALKYNFPTEIVDMTLKDFDKNDDGLISLAEYINKVKGSS